MTERSQRYYLLMFQIHQEALLHLNMHEFFSRTYSGPLSESVILSTISREQVTRYEECTEGWGRNWCLEMMCYLA